MSSPFFPSEFRCTFLVFFIPFMSSIPDLYSFNKCIVSFLCTVHINSSLSPLQTLLYLLSKFLSPIIVPCLKALCTIVFSAHVYLQLFIFTPDLMYYSTSQFCIMYTFCSTVFTGNIPYFESLLGLLYVPLYKCSTLRKASPERTRRINKSRVVFAIVNKKQQCWLYKTINGKKSPCGTRKKMSSSNLGNFFNFLREWFRQQ
jgi:hypothetical protein